MVNIQYKYQILCSKNNDKFDYHSRNISMLICVGRVDSNNWKLCCFSSSLKLGKYLKLLFFLPDFHCLSIFLGIACALSIRRFIFSLNIREAWLCYFFEYIVLLHLLCSLPFLPPIYVTLFMIVLISVFFSSHSLWFSQMFPSK